MEKNYNPTGKQLFVIYICNNCGNTDSTLVPPKLKQNIPFFIKCDCGGYTMYYGAYDTAPYKPSQVMASVMLGEKKYLDMIKKHEFKEYTDKLKPDGTLDHDNLPTIDIDFGPDNKIDAMVLPPKNRKKNKNPISAKQICPICENEFIIKDIELFCKINEEAWNIVKKLGPKTEEVMKKHEVYKKNSPEYIKKQLKEKGYFTGICQPCMSKMAWSQQLKLGL